jgi:hypothetical protein
VTIPQKVSTSVRLPALHLQRLKCMTLLIPVVLFVIIVCFFSCFSSCFSNPNSRIRRILNLIIKLDNYPLRSLSSHLMPSRKVFSHDGSEMLMTPSPIVPSMPKTPRTPRTDSTFPHKVTAPWMRQRQVSTEYKQSKKKPGSFVGGLFRTMSGSGFSKSLESPVT